MDGGNEIWLHLFASTTKKNKGNARVSFERTKSNLAYDPILGFFYLRILTTSDRRLIFLGKRQWGPQIPRYDICSPVLSSLWWMAEYGKYHIEAMWQFIRRGCQLLRAVIFTTAACVSFCLFYTSRTLYENENFFSMWKGWNDYVLLNGHVS